MEEVLREILHVFEHMEGHKPLFTWSAQECEIIQKSDEVTLWGKPLSKVWRKWPCWNASNTIIMDHHLPRVECNPEANVICPPSFYVANMTEIAEDNEYLKQELWPALEVLYLHHDVKSFWSTVTGSSMQAGVCQVNPYSRAMASRRACTEHADTRLHQIGGEGTVDLTFTVDSVPSPTARCKSNIILIVVVCVGALTEGATGQDPEGTR
jgi:hypothetical protein